MTPRGTRAHSAVASKSRDMDTFDRNCAIYITRAMTIGNAERVVVDETKGIQQAEDPRVRLAGERTMLAWIRTGLAMMGFGFVVARFGVFLREITNATQVGSPRSTSLSLWIGAGLIVLGIVVNVAAALQHIQFLRRLDNAQPYQPSKWSLAVLVALLLAAVGVGMVVYLLSLPHPLPQT
jgi:putative membrane protein